MTGATADLSQEVLARVGTLLMERGELGQGTELSARLITGGRSNLTYELTSPTRSLVLRRPPLAHVLTTAHDMAREFRFISAIHMTDRRVPVPKPVLLCEDTEILGAAFYLMEHVVGDVLRTADSALALTDHEQHTAATDLVDVLGNLHLVEPSSVGLQGHGKPAGFMGRQVKRWRRQLEASRSRDLTGIDALAEGLAATIPAQAYSSVIHGDYRLDNCIIKDGRIAAVLDWEMAALGDPLADVGLFAVYYGGLLDLENAVVDSLAGLGSFPPLETLLEQYSRHTGHDLTALDWYIAFAWFKFAVILEGIHYRSIQGATSGDSFNGVAQLVQPSIDRGRAALAGYNGA